MIVAGVEKNMTHKSLQLTGFQEGILPFRYLGVPVKPQRLSVQECSMLVERMLAKVRAWPAKKLTYAGRVQLVNFVLLSIMSMTYWTQMCLRVFFIGLTKYAELLYGMQILT